MICHNCKQEIGSAATCPYCGTIMLKEPQPHHLSAGTLIDGKYTIEGVLGEGGFGITYLARNKKLGLKIAVKEYFPHGFAYRNTTDGDRVFVSTGDTRDYYQHGRDRFLKEAQTLAQFQSEPGVVSVTDFVEENNTAYLIMEYIEGVTLMQYMRQNGVMDAKETFAMFEPMMKTLEKIHSAGVIHRDISPDNIMRLDSGQLKLMDFGAAREYIDDNRSMSVMLKQGYAPLEQYRRNGEQGPWTDIYALCATIYHCITGKRPADALDRIVEDTLQKPSALGVDISPALEEVLMYGLAIHQKDRCQSMTELIDLLEKAKQNNTECIGITANKEEETSDTEEIADLTEEPNDQKTEVLKEESPDIDVTDFPKDNSFDSIVTVVSQERNTDPDVTILADPNTTIHADEPCISEEVKDTDRSKGSEAAKDTPVSDIRISRKKKTGIIAGAVAAVLAVIISIIMVNSGKSTGIKKEDIPEEDLAESAVEETISGKKWEDIIAISGNTSVTYGLKKDGTVVATEIIYENSKYDVGQTDVEGWTDIVAISAGAYHVVGLKKDGTVVSTKVESNGFHPDVGQTDVEDWTDIVQVSAGNSFTVGLKKDGTVVATKITFDYYDQGQCDVEDWTDIVAISAGDNHTVGLKKDGTLVAVGNNLHHQCEVDDWTDIAAVFAGMYQTLAIKKDGTVIANRRDVDVEEWTDIVEISVNNAATAIGLRKDGTVVGAGTESGGALEVGNWTDIVAISAGFNHTIGLKSDGTLVTAGSNLFGECDVYD